ncbi:DUF4153 domain-containing protein [Lentibacillus saliphilus]|uniref:DUF4153 domain-containing protein n=1 Tax=Lentibacillus saliphilus TaxID=2737028 RepID=UPI001C2FC5CA|nr:DUF4173 domain-containing protein [Lentibacillus saliphilus]
MRYRNIVFMIMCLGLGLLAEQSFFHGYVGISFLVFITGFYSVLFAKVRLSFTNRRIGLLLMGSIWLLAASFAVYDTVLFRQLNMLLIPTLIFVHVVTITSPNEIQWSKLSFITLLLKKLKEICIYAFSLIWTCGRWLLKGLGKEQTRTIKHVVLGVAIGVPLFIGMTGLLMLADDQFQNVVVSLSTHIIGFNQLEVIVRTCLAVGLGLLFFALFQVLKRPETPRSLKRNNQSFDFSLNEVTALTILLILNAVYILFVIVQFKYFFGQSLQPGFTYASYARRGFFELISVTVVNLTLLVVFLKLVKQSTSSFKIALRGMYVLLVTSSVIMLVSAFQRLLMYEAAYGFTVERLLAHIFMIFLMVIFAYTFIRIWIERLALLHFYLIVGLVFYTGIHAINLEQIVVTSNLERYAETHKIDIEYMEALSWTGVDGLMTLYEQNPDYPGLKEVLQIKMEELPVIAEQGWQSFNVVKSKTVERLNNLQLKE